MYRRLISKTTSSVSLSLRRHLSSSYPISSAPKVIRSSLGIKTLLQKDARPLSAGKNLGASTGVHPRSYSSTTAAFQDYPSHTLFSMPALSPTMESGTIASWNLQVGDSFSAGDVLCSIETDKASVDFEAQDDGVLAKILREGANAADLPIGTPICVVVEEEGHVAAFADFQLSEQDTAVVTSSPTAGTDDTPSGAGVSPPSSTASPPSNRQVSDDFLLLPSARHLAFSKKIDVSNLAGSAKGGRITKGDILQALEQGVSFPSLLQDPSAGTVSTATSPEPSSPSKTAQSQPSVKSVPLVDLPIPQPDTDGTYEDVTNSKMRKIIAKRLTESKREVPHFYTSAEVQLDNILKLRKKLVSEHEVKVSVNDFVIRCCALALRDVPQVNRSYDVKTGTVKSSDSIDVSVAVATPTGLITPIVFDTDKIGLYDITNKIKDLATRARDGKLAPHEYQGGTFSVSNLGMFGIDEFSAVINPPQAAILAVGGGTRRVVPTPYVDGETEQKKPEIKTIMTARLSADRRVVDEATAALFMKTFQLYINKPELLLL